MNKCVKSSERIYLKSFPGASTTDTQDYVKPSKRHNPDLVILHSGSNDLRSNKSPEEISDDIVKLALDLKTDENEVVISGIVCRKDELNAKGLKVNDLLKIKSAKYAIAYGSNAKILNGSWVHLNYVTLSDNCLNIIKT